MICNSKMECLPGVPPSTTMHAVDRTRWDLDVGAAMLLWQRPAESREFHRRGCKSEQKFSAPGLQN